MNECIKKIVSLLFLDERLVLLYDTNVQDILHISIIEKIYYLEGFQFAYSCKRLVFSD